MDIINEAAGAADVLRIAVPTDGQGGGDAVRSMHFGHSASFTPVDVAGGAVVATSPARSGGGPPSGPLPWQPEHEPRSTSTVPFTCRSGALNV